eukprot:1357367-Amphidinium_carterae.1
MCSTSSRSFCSANWRPAQCTDSIQAPWTTSAVVVYLLSAMSVPYVTIQALKIPQPTTTIF